ncbi:MAG: hypothetical protein ACT4QD_19055 [Acidobacteriota bacterium]
MTNLRLLLALIVLVSVPVPGQAQRREARQPEAAPAPAPSTIRGAGSATAPGAAVQTPDPVTIPMELLANRPIVRVTVNGRGPFPFLIAPEAAMSAIDAELAELVKVREPSSRRGESHPVVELGVNAATNTIPTTMPVTFTVPVRVAEVGRIMPDFAPPSLPRGIISLSAFADRLVRLDFARFRLTIETGALPQADGKGVFSLSASGRIGLPLSIGGTSVDCHVDPLFKGGLLLPATYATNLPLHPSLRDLGGITTPTGAFRAREGQLTANAHLGPFELKTPLVLFADGAEAATIGVQWLSQYVVTYDLANARVRLDRPSQTTEY